MLRCCCYMVACIQTLNAIFFWYGNFYANSFNIYVFIFQNFLSYKPFFYIHNFSATIFIANYLYSGSQLLDYFGVPY